MIKLSDEQQRIVDLASDLKSEKNILVVGRAGCGKSVLVHAIKAAFEEHSIAYVVGAPTGVAAINIGGETIHKIIQKLRNGLYDEIDAILIDEASMLCADLFDELEHALYASKRGVKKVAGGVKIILVGDLAQLPPVIKEGSAEEEYLLDNYWTPYFFSSACYGSCEWDVQELTKIFRQTDPNYTKMLHNIRRGGKVTNTVKYLNDHHVTDRPVGVFLTPTNKACEEINDVALALLDSPETSFQCAVFGKIFRHEYPAPEFVKVKIGAQIMVIKNIYGVDDDGNERLELINGDMGEVREIEEHVIRIFCPRTNQEHDISRFTWDQTESVYDKKTKTLNKTVVASFSQFPIRLAWAVTIHKSQGATIQELTIDLRRPMFAAGQLYVALSRGVSLDGLHIIGKVSEKDVITCPIVNAFLNDFKTGTGIKPGSRFEGYLAKRLQAMNSFPSAGQNGYEEKTKPDTTP